MTREQLRQLLQRASPSTQARNPGLVAGLQAAVSKPQQGKTLVEVFQDEARRQGGVPRGGSGKRRVRVRRPVLCVALVACVRRRHDDDNLIAGLKPLRDVVARELGVDDGDGSVSWEYGQVVTRGAPGTMVSIRPIG